VLRTAFAIGAWMLFGCSQPETYPRPWGYHRLEFPPVEYARFSHPNCPFEFDYPAHGRLELARVDSCFFNVYFPAFDCRWHVTSRPLGGKVTHSFAYEDHRELVYKHTQKGTIFDKPLRTPYGKGTLYELYGEVPTAAQLYFSDSTTHAVELSFYFNTALKNDSLAPVIDRMKKDLLHMVESLRWK
jgi:gliding motility-associated lipoprotein GldD